MYESYRNSVQIFLYNSDKQEILNGNSLSYVYISIIPQYSLIRAKCLDLKELNEKTMYITNSKAIQNTRRAVYSTTIIAAIVIVIVLIFSQALSERIIKPIKDLMNASKRISNGDYKVRISEFHGGEIEGLSREFNYMAEKLENYHNINIEQVISEKNKGEAIISSIADGLIVFDMNSAVVSINPEARNILNLGFVDLSGLKCEDIFINENVCNVIESISETGALNKMPDEKRIISISNNGEFNHYIYTATLILGRNKKPSGIVLLLKNITKLRELEQMKNEFVMAASHELKTPLTSIAMSVDLLYESSADLLPEKDKELLSVARDEILRMKSLINDLLDLSSLESGKIVMDFENVPIDEIFRKVHEIFAKQAEYKKVSLEYEMEKNLPLILVDSNKITWVLSNLVSNALRYVGENGKIKYKAKKAGRYIYFYVQDNGKGIPDEYKLKIFDKFSQVKGDHSGGSGLGLAICKEIIRAHGGSIWVESIINEGSVFIFTIPIK